MASKVGKNDLALLASIANYKVLTVKQLSVLSGNSGQVVRKRMRPLKREGLITTRMEGYGGGRGRPEDLLFLAEKGAAVLVGDGARKAACITDKADDRLFVDHLLLTNWFHIHLIQIERAIPDLSVHYLSRESYAMKFDSDAQEKCADFIPDGVFAITHKGDDPKTLLFFLEVDMGTETIASTDRGHKDIRQKILKYQTLFRTGQYKQYQSVFNSKLNGFRLLFLTNSNPRCITLCRLVREMPPSDFIWLVDQERMFSHGLSAKIWARGGRNDDPQQSIVGPELASELP